LATEAARCVRDYARDVLRLSYAVSAILPENARSQRVAERSGAQVAGQMEVVGATWDRYLWPLATGYDTRLEPAIDETSVVHVGMRCLPEGKRGDDY
jgi:Acetyltransferase (GNAT) domain